MSLEKCPFATCTCPFSRCAAHPSSTHATESQAKKRHQEAVTKNSSLKKEGRRSAKRRGPGRIEKRCGAHPFSCPPNAEDRGRRDLTERARSPFGAPPRHSPRFYPRLGSGRASWNHRMQAGGPSPAPVQRAPRSPTRAGPDDAQAARERSVSQRSREPLPLRLKEYPRERRPSRAGWWLGNRCGDESQE
jgi:hypothetical protein